MVESIEHFVKRLRIYTETSHSMPEVDEIMVKLMVEVISTLTLVTGKLKKRRLRKSSSRSLNVLHHLRRRSQMDKEFLRGQGH